jgi:hypothetical protein
MPSQPNQIRRLLNDEPYRTAEGNAKSSGNKASVSPALRTIHHIFHIVRTNALGSYACRGLRSPRMV